MLETGGIEDEDKKVKFFRVEKKCQLIFFFRAFPQRFSERLMWDKNVFNQSH